MSPEAPEDPRSGGATPARRGRSRLALLAVTGVALLVFALLNLASVKVDWIVGSGHSPLIVVILVSFLLGALFGPALRHRGRRRG